MPVSDVSSSGGQGQSTSHRPTEMLRQHCFTSVYMTFALYQCIGAAAVTAQCCCISHPVFTLLACQHGRCSYTCCMLHVKLLLCSALLERLVGIVGSHTWRMVYILGHTSPMFWFWFWNVVGKLADVGMSRQRRVRRTTVDGS